jgi:hypothetical protein
VQLLSSSTNLVFVLFEFIEMLILTHIRSYSYAMFCALIYDNKAAA